MRNLKKILALVLALVMSLSLMATASAAETAPTDSANAYATAEKVLEGLGVFKGDAGTGAMRYDSNVMRSEAAALLYRIMTGDVKGEQEKLYSNQNFTDGVTGHWGEGPIAYCYNAEIIKGVNAAHTLFDPNGNVTGYQLLAMALRALGYGRNGEFEGNEWIIQTAATAEREGLLKGVTPSDSVTLGQSATRGLVAQILFNAMLHKTVRFSALYPNNYEPEATTLGYQKLGLEEIEGVVMANQWADLENTKVLADGKTRMKADGKDYTLDYASEREDIGESRLAYVQNGAKVLHLVDSGKNVVKSNYADYKTMAGEAMTVANLRGSLDVTDAQYFANYDEYEENVSEWLIRYSIAIWREGVGYASWYSVNPTDDSTKYLTEYGLYLNGKLNGDYALFPDGTTNRTRNATYSTQTVKKTGTGTGALDQIVLTVSIQPGEIINEYDMDLMQMIFYTADRVSENPTAAGALVNYYVDGEVYAGTTSLTDKSDVMTWNKFKADYLTAREWKFTSVLRGNELKIIDNDNDGKAEYVLRTNYVLDKIIRSETANDVTTYYYQSLNTSAYKPVYLDGYTPVVEEVVLYARIDGTAQIQKAGIDTAAFKAVTYTNLSATDTDGKVWYESGITNGTTMPGSLTGVDENVSYTLYLDKYGFVRAYYAKTNYALVTEIYPTNTRNQAFVTNRDLTAEVVLGDALPAEYSLSNAWTNGFNPFYTADFWYYAGINDGWWGTWTTGADRPNYLSRAQHGLGYSVTGDLFNFGTAANPQYSWTNVAKYTLGEDSKSITLTTAANLTGSTWTKDYVQLAVGSVTNTNPIYKISASDPMWSSLENVRAVDTTEFFVVARADRQIRHYVGYKNIPASLTVATNGVRAIYAVGDRTTKDARTSTYWLADVIVIEIETFASKVDSVSLIYSNDYKISGDYKYLQAIDSEKGKIGIIPNDLAWTGQFNARGFYTLRNTKAVPDAENIYTADIEKVYDGTIQPRAGLSASLGYNANGIYYGYVQSLDGEQQYSTYITVRKPVAKASGLSWETTAVTLTGGVYGIDGTISTANTAPKLITAPGADRQVKPGDEIVWVEGSKHSFAIDLTDYDIGIYGNTVKRAWNPTPTWLYVQSWDGTDGDAAGRGEVGNVIRDQITYVAATQNVGYFYGEPLTTGVAGVSVSYGNALKWWTGNGNGITLEPGYSIVSCTPSIPAAPDATKNVTYTLTVQNTAGTVTYEYTLTQRKMGTSALTLNAVDSKSIIASIDADNVITPIAGITVGDMTITQFMNAVSGSTDWEGAIQEGSWTFYHNTAADGLTAINPLAYDDTFMYQVAAWTLTVFAEDGTYVTYFSDAVTAGTKTLKLVVKTDDVIDETDAVLTPNKGADGKDDGSYTLRINKAGLSKAIVEINGTAYEVKNGDQLKAADEDWITITLAKTFIDRLFEKTNVIVVVVRAYVPGETVLPVPSTPVEDDNADFELKAAVDGVKARITVDEDGKNIINVMTSEPAATVGDLLGWNDNDTATVTVYDTDGKTDITANTTTALKDGMTVKVVSEDGKVTKTYTIKLGATLPKEQFKITDKSDATKVTVTVVEKAEAGATVTVKAVIATGATGLELESIVVTNETSKEPVKTEGSVGNWTFEMPEANVTVEVKTAEDTDVGGGDIKPEDPEVKKDDLEIDVDWYLAVPEGKDADDVVISKDDLKKIVEDALAAEGVKDANGNPVTVIRWVSVDTETLWAAAVVGGTVQFMGSDYETWTVSLTRNWKVSVKDPDTGKVTDIKLVPDNSPTDVTVPASVAAGPYLFEDIYVTTDNNNTLAANEGYVVANSKITGVTTQEDIVLVPALEYSVAANTKLVVIPDSQDSSKNIDRPSSGTSADAGFVQIGLSAQARFVGSTTGTAVTKLTVSGESNAVYIEPNAQYSDYISFKITSASVGNVAGDEDKADVLCVEAEQGYRISINGWSDGKIYTASAAESVTVWNASQSDKLAGGNYVLVTGTQAHKAGATSSATLVYNERTKTYTLTGGLTGLDPATNAVKGTVQLVSAVFVNTSAAAAGGFASNNFISYTYGTLGTVAASVDGITAGTGGWYTVGAVLTVNQTSGGAANDRIIATVTIAGQDDEIVTDGGTPNDGAGTAAKMVFEITDALLDKTVTFSIEKAIPTITIDMSSTATGSNNSIGSAFSLGDQSASTGLANVKDNTAIAFKLYKAADTGFTTDLAAAELEAGEYVVEITLTADTGFYFVVDSSGVPQVTVTSPLTGSTGLAQTMTLVPNSLSGNDSTITFRMTFTAA